MSLAFEEVFAVANAFQGIPMAGRTDAWILNDAAAAHGIPQDSPDLARFKDAYVRHLAIELEKPGVARKGLMPGVRELLDALAPRPDVFLALLTGNYEAGARLKLEYFDLWKYFPCGAFGDDAPHRNVLVPKALRARGGLRRAVVRRGGRHRHRRHAARRRLRRARRRAIARGRDGKPFGGGTAGGGRGRGAEGSQRHGRSSWDNRIYGSERGPVALPVFKIGRFPFTREGWVRLPGASAISRIRVRPGSDLGKSAFDETNVAGARPLLRILRGKLDPLTLAQELEHGTADRAAVEKVLNPALVADEPEPLVD